MSAIVWFQPYARRIVDSAKNAATHQVATIPHPMSQQSWRLSGQEWRMKIVSIQHRFCGELVVNNPVGHRSDDASDSDLKGFHRVVGLDWIVLQHRDITRWPNCRARRSGALQRESYTGNSSCIDPEVSSLGSGEVHHQPLRHHALADRPSYRSDSPSPDP